MREYVRKKRKFSAYMAVVLALLLLANPLVGARAFATSETADVAEHGSVLDQQLQNDEAPTLEQSADAEQTNGSVGGHLLGASADDLQITSLTSTNASSYLTGPTNLQHLQVVGYYTLLNDTTGSLITVTLDNNGQPYFLTPSTEVTAGLITLPSGATDLNVSSSDGHIAITFKVSGSRGAAGSFTINYPFDHSAFDGWVAKGTKLAVVTASGEDTGAAQSINVTSNANDNRSLALSKVPATDLAADTDAVFNFSFEDERHSDTVRSNWRMEPGSDLTLTLNYPAGAVVSGNKRAAGSGMTGVDDGNGALVFAMGTADADGIVQSGWSSVDLVSGRRLLDFPTFKLNFPASEFNVGDTVTVSFTAQYTLYGKPAQTVQTKSVTFKIIAKQIHMKENAFSVSAGYTPYVSIDEPAYESVYMKISGVANAGTEPIPNACITWNNDTSNKRALPNRISFFNLGIFFKYEAIFVIKSDRGGADRTVDKFINAPTVLGNGTNTAIFNISSLSLTPGEYVSSIQIFPLNNPNDSVASLTNKTATANRELPYSAQAEVNIFFRSWDGGFFPDGVTKINNADESHTTVNLTWDDESKPETHKDATVSDNTYSLTKTGANGLMVYYGFNAPNPRTYYTWAASVGSLSPGAEVTATVNCYNNYTSSCQTWKNPVILLLPPDIVTLNPNQAPAVFKNGAKVGDVTISETTVIGKRMYVATLPALTVGRSMGYDADLYKFDLTFTVKPNTLPGRYYMANTSAAGYPATAGLIFGTSATPNNIAFSSFHSAANFIADTYDYDSYDGTDKLNPPAKALYFDVSTSNEMRVSSNIFNNEANEGNGAWENVTAGTVATVPLGGTGLIQLRVLNAGNTYLSDVYLLDILPFVGDSKKSQWDARLHRVDLTVLDADGNDVTVSEGFAGSMSLEYCANGDPSYSDGGITRSGSGAFADDADIKDAKTFLFKMTGKRLPPAYTIVITSEVKAPYTATVSDIDKLAYNQFTANANFYATAVSNDPKTAGQFTPNDQAFKLTNSMTGSLTKSGLAFRDINCNNAFNNGDVKAQGITVNLYREDAHNLGFPESVPLKTTSTDENGQYDFSGLAGGNYFIEFEKPAGNSYFFGEPGLSTDDTASHVNPQTGMSNMFRLNPGQVLPAGVNAAIRVRLNLKVDFRLGAPDGVSVKTENVSLDMFDSLPYAGKVAPKEAAPQWSIPEGYTLKAGFPTEQSYSLDWDTPEATLIFVIKEKEPVTPAPPSGNDPSPVPPNNNPATPTPPNNNTPAPTPPNGNTPTPTSPNGKDPGNGDTGLDVPGDVPPLGEVTPGDGTPLKPATGDKTSSAPKTGDTPLPLIWLVGTLLALLAAAGAFIMKKRIQ